MGDNILKGWAASLSTKFHYVMDHWILFDNNNYIQWTVQVNQYSTFYSLCQIQEVNNRFAKQSRWHRNKSIVFFNWKYCLLFYVSNSGPETQHLKQLDQSAHRSFLGLFQLGVLNEWIKEMVRFDHEWYDVKKFRRQRNRRSFQNIVTH